MTHHDEFLMKESPAQYGAAAQASLNRVMEECGMETPAVEAHVSGPRDLTADQQIVLKCMEIVGQEMSSASLSPKGRKLFRDTVDELIHRATTGEWPE